MMESPTQKFTVVCGEVTEEEDEYLIRKGLKYENSKGELLEVSTDVEDISCSSLLSHSQQESLLMFEENERLLSELSDSNSKVVLSLPVLCGSAEKGRKSNVKENKTPQRPETINEIDNFDDEEENKENVFNDSYCLPQPKWSVSPKSFSPKLAEGNRISRKISFIIKDDDAEDAPGIVDESMVIINQTANMSNVSDDNFVVPCTQYAEASNQSYKEEEIDVIPPTQEVPLNSQNSSLNQNSELELVPCTQAIEEESHLDISSVPCSQESVGLSGSSKEDLDDTLTVMTRLLELAEEQEAAEKALIGKQQETVEANCNSGTAEKSQNDQQQDAINTECNSEPTASKIDQQDNSAGEFEVSFEETKEDIFFKTPLKHTRVQLLKSKTLCTPSPPRSYVNSILQKGAARKTQNVKEPLVLMSQQPEVMLAIAAANSPKLNAGVASNSPKRAPLANITPAKPKKTATNTSTPRAFKTPVAAKVDSGLRGRTSPFQVGLSPVANYIYSKPAPSTFARVQGIAKSTPTNNPQQNLNIIRKSSVTRIPVFPSRISQAQAPPKTPSSASKEPPRRGSLRTSTFFDTTCTPPKIISNQVVDSKKRFQPLQYTGSTKVKVVNSKVASPKTDYVAHRHTGLRDESGNASFIQNTFIQKKNIPQSRLVTPKSYKNA